MESASAEPVEPVSAEGTDEQASSGDGVLEPALLEGICFAALNSVNTKLCAALTGPEVDRLAAAAVYAAADGLGMLRGWAADTGIDSLSQLLDEAQQLIALLIQGGQTHRPRPPKPRVKPWSLRQKSRDLPQFWFRNPALFHHDEITSAYKLTFVLRLTVILVTQRTSVAASGNSVADVKSAFCSTLIPAF